MAVYLCIGKPAAGVAFDLVAFRRLELLRSRLAEADSKRDVFRACGYHASADVQMDRAERLNRAIAAAVAHLEKGKVLVTPSKTSHLWDSGTSGAV